MYLFLKSNCIKRQRMKKSKVLSTMEEIKTREESDHKIKTGNDLNHVI